MVHESSTEQWSGVYIFTGRLQPERIPIELHHELTVTFRADDAPVWCRLAVFNTQVAIIARTPVPVVDRDNLLVSLWDVASMVTESAAFVHGIMFTIDQISLIDLTDDTFMGIQSRIAIPELSASKLQVDDLVSVATGSRPLRTALTCFRDALASPFTSPIAAYRGVEAIAAAFAESGSSRSAMWMALREELHVDREWLQLLVDESAPRRHGIAADITAARRSEVMRRMWLLIERFIVYLRAGAEGISSLPTLHESDAESDV